MNRRELLSAGVVLSASAAFPLWARAVTARACWPGGQVVAVVDTTSPLAPRFESELTAWGAKVVSLRRCAVETWRSAVASTLVSNEVSVIGLTDWASCEMLRDIARESGMRQSWISFPERARDWAPTSAAVHGLPSELGLATHLTLELALFARSRETLVPSQHFRRTALWLLESVECRAELSPHALRTKASRGAEKLNISEMFNE